MSVDGRHCVFWGPVGVFGGKVASPDVDLTGHSSGDDTGGPAVIGGGGGLRPWCAGGYPGGLLLQLLMPRFSELLWLLLWPVLW